MSKLKLVSKLTEFVNTGGSKKITHGHVGVFDKYPCANPGGSVDNSDCDDGDPLCNCPCQELKPDSEEELNRLNAELHGTIPPEYDEDGNVVEGTEGVARLYTILPDELEEPTDEKVEASEQSIKECGAIVEYLPEGEKWLGCLWNDMEHPSSCNCPCVGERFGEYLDYTRTYSTYWDTPPEQQLWRNAQLQLVTSQKAAMRIHGDLTLRPGTLIYIRDAIGNPMADNKTRISGRWLVASVNHTMGGFPNAHSMILELIRDTQVNDPNKDVDPWQSIWDRINELIG